VLASPPATAVALAASADAGDKEIVAADVEDDGTRSGRAPLLDPAAVPKCETDVEGV